MHPKLCARPQCCERFVNISLECRVAHSAIDINEINTTVRSMVIARWLLLKLDNWNVHIENILLFNNPRYLCFSTAKLMKHQLKTWLMAFDEKLKSNSFSSQCFCFDLGSSVRLLITMIDHVGTSLDHEIVLRLGWIGKEFQRKPTVAYHCHLVLQPNSS
jgi:hypothetical protein